MKRKLWEKILYIFKTVH